MGDVTVRPWGSFEVLYKDNNCVVKVITVEKGQKLSYQYHNNRDEQWTVAQGKPEITLDVLTETARAGDMYFIPKRLKHRLSAPDGLVKIIEVSTGEVDENDIVRLEDIYGRPSNAYNQKNIIDTFK